jgi:hypothetical protein
MAQNDSFLPVASGLPATDTLAPPDVPPDPERATGPAPPASGAPRRRRRPLPPPEPPERRRGRPRLARSIAGVLHKIIDAAKGLSRREFARVLAGILLILAMGVMIPIVNHVSELGIILYAVVCAALIIVLVKDEAVKKALIIMGFAVSGIVVVTLAHSMSRFVDNRINVQPVPGPAQRRLVYGTVVDRARHPLADVFVRARGDGISVQTDAAGRFSFTVVESAFTNNTAEFSLFYEGRVDSVSQTVGDGEVTLVFDAAAQPPAPSIAERARQNARLMSTPSRPVSGEAAVAVIVDSIYTHFDGKWGAGSADWTFRVFVPDGTPIHIRTTTYNDQKMMAVGSETDVPLKTDTLTVTVVGIRRYLALWNYRLQGSLALAANDIPADRPLRRRILVHDGPTLANGQFYFYITLLKLPARPEAD